MNGGLAHDLTELLFEHGKELVAAHPESRDLDPARAQRVIAPIGLHSGRAAVLRPRRAVTV